MAETQRSCIGEQISNFGSCLWGTDSEDNFNMEIEKELFTIGLDKDEENGILQQFENNHKQNDCNLESYQYATQHGQLNILNWMAANNININGNYNNLDIDECDLYDTVVPIEEFIREL